MSTTQEKYLVILEQIRWGGVPTCPYCGSVKAAAFKTKRRYHCNNCFTSYSVTVGTLFHKTHVNLHKWFRAIELVLNLSSPISVRQLAKEIEVSKNTAAFMIYRIRRAMQEEPDFLQNLMMHLGQLQASDSSDNQ